MAFLDDIYTEEEFKTLEIMRQYISGMKIDLEFLLDNTNATEMEDDDEPFDMDGVREKLIEHTNDLCKVDTALIAILNGTFDSDKHRLPKYDLSK